MFPSLAFSRNLQSAIRNPQFETKKMLTFLLILAALVWVPVALGLFRKRPLTVFLIWLVIGPVVTNVVRWPGANPFFWSGGNERAPQGYYLTEATSITVKELLEPTRVVVFMLLGVFVLKRIFTKKRRERIDAAELRMALFSALLVLSAILYSNRVAFGLRLGVDVFIVPFLAYFLMRRLVQQEDDFSKLTRVVGYLGFYVIIACALERVVNGPMLYRLKGPFVQGAARGSSVLHMVLIVVLFVGLLEVARRTGSRGNGSVLKREWRWFLVLGSPVMIALTWARGNWVGLALAFWLFLLLGRPLVERSKRLALIGAMLVVIPLAFIAAQGLVPSSLVEERIGETDNVHGRLETWRIAVNEGLTHPIFGIGLNNTRDALAKARTEIQGGFTYGIVHNSFLTFFAELGIVGLLLYLSISSAILRIGWKLYRKGNTRTLQWRGVVVIAIMLGYLTPGFFANTLQMSGFGHLLVFGFIGALVGVSYRPENLVAQEEQVSAQGPREIEVQPAMAGTGPVRPDKYRTVRW